MKWLIYGAGLLVSSIALTALRLSPLWQHLGGLAVGLITCAVYFFGVFFIPRKVVALIEARKAARTASASEVPPVQPVEPKRRPCKPYASGYQLVILVLAVALFLSLITESPAYRDLENEMETAVDEAYREGYNAGYDEGSAGRYEEGYLDGYNDGYEYRDSGGLWLPSERDALPSFSEWSDAKHGK